MRTSNKITLGGKAKSTVLGLSAILLASTAVPAFAQEAESSSGITVSGNAAVTSDYRFRGVSFSDGDIAIQGGIDVARTEPQEAPAWPLFGKDKVVDRDAVEFYPWVQGLLGGRFRGALGRCREIDFPADALQHCRVQARDETDKAGPHRRIAYRKE